MAHIKTSGLIFREIRMKKLISCICLLFFGFSMAGCTASIAKRIQTDEPANMKGFQCLLDNRTIDVKFSVVNDIIVIDDIKKNKMAPDDSSIDDIYSQNLTGKSGFKDYIRIINGTEYNAIGKAKKGSVFTKKKVGVQDTIFLTILSPLIMVALVTDTRNMKQWLKDRVVAFYNENEISRIGTHINYMILKEFKASTKNCNSILSFLKKYPESGFENSPCLQRNVAELSKDYNSIELFLTRYPHADFERNPFIKKKISEFIDAEYHIAVNSSVKSKKNFIRKYKKYGKIEKKMRKALDDQEYFKAKKMNSISRYQKYLANYPSGRHRSNVRAKMAFIYKNMGTFNGLMQSFKISGDKKLLKKAAHSVDNSKGKVKASNVLLELYFSERVKALKDIPSFRKLLSRLKGKNSETTFVIYFKDKIIRFPDFGENLTIDNYTRSIEYMYVLKSERPKIKSFYNGSTFGLKIQYKDKKFTFEQDASCKLKNTYYETKSLGFFEGLGNAFSGGEVKSKNVYYDLYKCSATATGIKKCSKLEKVLTGSSKQTANIRNAAGWENHKYAKTTYNKSSGSSSSGGSSPPYIQVQADCGYSCLDVKLSLSGGSGNFSSSNGEGNNIGILKGYDGALAGTYRYVVTSSCRKTYSGSFRVSGKKSFVNINLSGSDAYITEH